MFKKKYNSLEEENKLNQMKVEDIKEKHENLKENEFLGIFFSGNVTMNIFARDNPEINNDFVAVGKAKGFIKYIVLYDIYTMQEGSNE